MTPKAPGRSRPSRGGFLGPKLTPPTPQARHAERQDLMGFLQTQFNARVILFRAPAGLGKSTSMVQFRQHLAGQDIATAWLSLDATDNDPTRFMTGLEAAMDVLHDTPEQNEEDPTGGSDTDRALSLLDRIRSFPRPFALFLDEFDLLESEAVVSLARRIIDELPRTGRLVIGCRALPDLRVGRLSVRGQLVEIDASRLRFSRQETSDFLRRANSALTAEDIDRLQAVTEGWPAALWLASILLERGEQPGILLQRFSEGERSLTDYLAEEVLATQPPPIREFLLRTSILRTLEASLCDALIPGADCGRILRELETSNVLLVPLDAPGTFRYHSLLGGFLRLQLQQQHPAEVPRLHNAASLWFERQARPVPAIDHAIEGGDRARATQLLERHAFDFIAQGRMRLMSRWLQALPPDALASRPMLQVAQIWATCFVRGAWKAMELLSASNLEASPSAEVLSHVRALKPGLLAMMDRFEEAYDAGLPALQHLPSTQPLADALLANAMATTCSVLGEYQRAHGLIDAARKAQGENAGAFNVMYSEVAEGSIDLQQGRLRQATARFRLAVTATRGKRSGYSGGNAWAGILFASVVHEAGDSVQAEDLLQVYLPLIRDVGLADHVIEGHRLLARIEFARGNVDQALQQLAELEYVGHGNRLVRVAAAAKLERARFLLLQGHHRSAAEEMNRAEDAELWERVRRLRYMANDLDYLELARLRYDAHHGHPAIAVSKLNAAVRRAEEDERARRALKLRLLQTIALRRAGSPAEAQKALVDVLQACAAEGFMRLVLDEGDQVVTQVQELAMKLRPESSRSNPVLTDYVMRLSGPVGDVETPASFGNDAPNAPLDQLTPKEIHILRLVAEGYSNSALAEKLIVSESTVRSHLRSINSKLGVHSRMQAVALARRIGIMR